MSHHGAAAADPSADGTDVPPADGTDLALSDRTGAALPDGTDVALPDRTGAALPDRTGAAPAGSSDLHLDEAVLAAQRGDSAAFRMLYRDLQPRLLRYLRALVGDDAEDVASEAWLQIARDMPGFSGDHDRFRGWASTIARHRALDHLRRASRRPPSAPVPADALTGLAAVDDTAELAMEAISTDAAIRLIASLPSDQAEAVLLRAVVGLDADTAGQILGKRAGAVRTAAYRGLRSLARRLPA